MGSYPEPGVHQWADQKASGFLPYLSPHDLEHKAHHHDWIYVGPGNWTQVHMLVCKQYTHQVISPVLAILILV